MKLQTAVKRFLHYIQCHSVTITIEPSGEHPTFVEIVKWQAVH
jgi:hypothetical protein